MHPVQSVNDSYPELLKANFFFYRTKYLLALVSISLRLKLLFTPRKLMSQFFSFFCVMYDFFLIYFFINLKHCSSIKKKNLIKFANH